MAKGVKKELDLNAEERIKSAARTVFHQKGFAAARTRDIAEAAEINLALLNYYFRSKERLFNIIMLETLQQFFQSMSSVFNNKDASFLEKVETLADRYIDLLIENPNVPIFVLNELKNNPVELMSKINVKATIMNSHFFSQWQQVVKKNKIKYHPLQLMMNLMALIMFPFISSPIWRKMGDIEEAQFHEMMQERKKLIPKWVAAMLQA